MESRLESPGNVQASTPYDAYVCAIDPCRNGKRHRSKFASFELSIEYPDPSAWAYSFQVARKVSAQIRYR